MNSEFKEMISIAGAVALGYVAGSYIFRQLTKRKLPPNAGGFVFRTQKQKDMAAAQGKRNPMRFAGFGSGWKRG